MVLSCILLNILFQISNAACTGFFDERQIRDLETSVQQSFNKQNKLTNH